MTSNSIRPGRPRTPRASRAERGTAVIEGALVLLTFVGMIIFVLDMGRILLMQQFLTERVRVAGRVAAVSNWDATAAKNFVCYNSTTAPAGGATTPGLLGLLPSQVSYNMLGTAGDPDYRIQMTISGVPAMIWIPYIAGQFTLAPITVTTPAQNLGVVN
jgi:Flp pilus assembly protein TadG